MKTTYVLLLAVFYGLPTLKAQELTWDVNRIDSVKSMVINTQADHFRIYFKDSLLVDWQNQNCRESHVNTASLVKSITGLAVGELLENGFIKSLDEPVCTYVPEWISACENGVTIRHLVTMTSGLEKFDVAGRIEFFSARDWNQHVYQLKIHQEPGSKWSYSNESGQMLEPLIKRASGMDTQEFYKKFLFGPMEMYNTHLMQDSVGNYNVIGGASTTMDDLSNLGLTMVNEGMFKGKQVVDEEWYKKSIEPISQNQYYGYLWWVDSQNKSFTAMGDGGKLVVVFPEKKLVFIRTRSCYEGGDTMRWMSLDFIATIGSLVKINN